MFFAAKLWIQSPVCCCLLPSYGFRVPAVCCCLLPGYRCRVFSVVVCFIVYSYGLRVLPVVVWFKAIDSDAGLVLLQSHGSKARLLLLQTRCCRPACCRLRFCSLEFFQPCHFASISMLPLCFISFLFISFICLHFYASLIHIFILICFFKKLTQLLGVHNVFP